MQAARLSRISSIALAGAATLGLSAISMTSAQTAPMSTISIGQIAGGHISIENVRYRGGYGRGYHGGYHRGPGIGGALAAGAALGIIGGAIAASQAPRYEYYDRGYVGAGYGAYGYTGPSYAYDYGCPAYSY